MFYSWDIMEPIAYTMLLANFTFGFFFYTLLKKDLELETIRELLSNRFAKRLYRKKRFDIVKFNRLQTEVEELRNVIS